MRLRQIALIARDLEPVVADLCAVLGTQISFRDPGVEFFGLHNAVMPVGDAFIEVVSPLRADSAGERYLQRRGGDSGYMVMVQTDDIDADRRRLETLGVRIVWSADLDDIRGMHLHPRDAGGAILSFDQPTPPASWRWAGPGWEELPPSTIARSLGAVDIAALDPQQLAQRWSEVLARPLDREGDCPRIELDEGRIRFVAAGDARQEGVVGIELTVHDTAAFRAAARARGCEGSGDEVRICGTEIRPVARDG